VLIHRVLQPALHYELEQVSKSEILRKLKQRFGAKIIRDIRFRVADQARLFAGCSLYNAFSVLLNLAPAGLASARLGSCEKKAFGDRL
jgi:hypothetical protein